MGKNSANTLPKVRSVFNELQKDGWLNKNRQLIPSKNLKNFKARGQNKIKYDPCFNVISKDSIKFILLHEDGHLSQPQRTHRVIFYLFLTAIPYYIVFIYLNIIEFDFISRIFSLLFWILIYLILFILLLKLQQSKIHQDEYDADSWSKSMLLGIDASKDASKIAQVAFQEMRAIVPSKNNIIIDFFRSIFHPTDAERIQRLSENGNI